MESTTAPAVSGWNCGDTLHIKLNYPQEADVDTLCEI